MIIIVVNENVLAKFDPWDGNKAMDWITQKALFRKEKVYMGDDTIWRCEPLPTL